MNITKKLKNLEHFAHKLEINEKSVKKLLKSCKLDENQELDSEIEAASYLPGPNAYH